MTLGAHEVDDLEAAVAHLRQDGVTGTIGLWGRSMGAVTALLFSQRDPSIAGIVSSAATSRCPGAPHAFSAAAPVVAAGHIAVHFFFWSLPLPPATLKQILYRQAISHFDRHGLL